MKKNAWIVAALAAALMTVSAGALVAQAAGQKDIVVLKPEAQAESKVAVRIVGWVLREDWDVVEVDMTGKGKVDLARAAEDVDYIEYAGMPRYLLDSRVLKGNPAEYVKSLVRAYNDDTTSPLILQHAYHEIALTLAKQGEKDPDAAEKAVAAYDRMLAKYPAGRYAASGRLELAALLLKQGKRDEAADRLKPLVDGRFGPKSAGAAKATLAGTAAGPGPGPATPAPDDKTRQGLSAAVDRMDHDHSVARADLCKWCASKSLFDQAVDQFVFMLAVEPTFPAARVTWDEISAAMPTTTTPAKLTLDDGSVVRGQTQFRPFLVNTEGRPTIVFPEDLGSLERLSAAGAGAATYRVTTKRGVYVGIVSDMKLQVKSALGNATVSTSKTSEIAVEAPGSASATTPAAATGAFLPALDAVARSADSEYAVYGLCQYVATAAGPSEAADQAKAASSEARRLADVKRAKSPPVRVNTPMPGTRLVLDTGEIVEGRVVGSSDAAVTLMAVTPKGHVLRSVPRPQVREQSACEISADKLNECAKNTLATAFLNAASSGQNLALLAAWGRMSLEFPEEKWDARLKDIAEKQKAAFDDAALLLRVAYKWAGAACPACWGVGSNPCKVCGGKGKIFNTSPCPDCGGRKDTVECPKCGGQGILTCTRCDGAGGFNSNDPFGGRETCGRCGGKGQVSCSRCGGKGTIIPGCGKCGGKGTITTSAACAACGDGVLTCAACDGKGKRKDGTLGDSPVVKAALAGPAPTTPAVSESRLSKPDALALRDYTTKLAALNQDQFTARMSMVAQLAKAGMTDEATKQLNVAAMLKPKDPEVAARLADLAAAMPAKSARVTLTLEGGDVVRGKCAPRPFVFTHSGGVLVLQLSQIRSLTVVKLPKVMIQTDAGTFTGTLEPQPLVVKTALGELTVPFEKLQGLVVDDNVPATTPATEPAGTTPATPAPGPDVVKPAIPEPPAPRPGPAAGTWDARVAELNNKGLEIVFVFDATGSMGPVLRELQARLPAMAAAISSVVPEARIGLVAYRDWKKYDPDDFEWVEQHATLRRCDPIGTAELSRFLAGIKAYGGGDIPEAVQMGIETAVQKSGWRPGTKKVIVVFGDAPPHKESGGLLYTYDLCRRFREGGATVSAIDTNRKAKLMDEFRQIGLEGGGEAASLDDRGGLARQLLLYVFGTKFENEVNRVFDAALKTP